MRFVTLSRDAGGVSVYIDATRVAAVVADTTGTGCAVYLFGGGEPIRVRESAHDVAKLCDPPTMTREDR